MTTITENLPRTGFVMPDADQLARLLEIVCQEYRQFRGAFGADEFRRAFWVAGTFFRRPGPVGNVYWAHWVDASNQKLERVGLAPISGPALLAACLAHADIAIQWPDPGVGALLEVGLDEYTGRSANNVWYDLLTGERGLMRPVLRDRGIARQEGVVVVRSASEM
jgi:hypothetical protein